MKATPSTGATSMVVHTPVLSMSNCGANNEIREKFLCHGSVYFNDMVIVNVSHTLVFTLSNKNV